MNWGNALALSLIAFAGLMGFFVVKAAQNPEPLVTEHYYEQELKYQERIDEAARANALSAAVSMEIAKGAVRLVFPPELSDRSISGRLTLLCTNDPAGDRTITIRSTDGRFTSAPMGMRAGVYHAQLAWTSDGLD